MPALIGVTGAVGRELDGVQPRPGAFRRGVELRLNVHERGVAEVQIALATPIFARAADILPPLKFRDGYFLDHNKPVPLNCIGRHRSYVARGVKIFINIIF